MNQMLDAGQYSDDEIIQAVAQLDAEEKARKQKEFSGAYRDWETIKVFFMLLMHFLLFIFPNQRTLFAFVLSLLHLVVQPLV